LIGSPWTTTAVLSTADCDGRQPHNASAKITPHIAGAGSTIKRRMLKFTRWYG